MVISSKLESRVSQLRDIILDIMGTDPLAQGRKRDLVTARTILACGLYAEGFTETDIGRALRKNHSTVNWYRKRGNQFSMPGWEAEMDLWEKFKQKK